MSTKLLGDLLFCGWHAQFATICLLWRNCSVISKAGNLGPQTIVWATVEQALTDLKPTTHQTAQLRQIVSDLFDSLAEAYNRSQLTTQGINKPTAQLAVASGLQVSLVPNSTLNKEEQY